MELIIHLVGGLIFYIILKNIHNRLNPDQTYSTGFDGKHNNHSPLVEEEERYDNGLPSVCPSVSHIFFWILEHNSRTK